MRRITLRVRLTLLYGGMFFLAGAVLLTVMYLLVQQDLNTRLGTGIARIAFTGPGAEVDNGGAPGTAQSGGAVSKQNVHVRLYDGSEVSLDQMPGALAKEQAQVRDQTLDTLLAQGGIALGGIGLVAGGFGWFMAERALRPVHQITATARRVAAAANADRGLRERIALAGPGDEIKELADTFDDMLERLDRSFDGQRRFVANASHELRTPLAINRAMAEVVATRPGASADARQLAESVLSINARHERLIDGLLMLAASENEVTARVAVDLSTIAGHVLDSTDLRGVECASRELGSGPVTGDPVLLERLVQNLVDNAVRHNRPGGWMTVTTGVAGGRAVLTVASTGRPVAPYEMERVFEPFRRLEGDRTRSDRGLGLGLSIVRAVARAHDGEAVAVAGPDGGLAVIVTLPAAPVSGGE